VIQLKALVGIWRAADSNHAMSTYPLADGAGALERLVLRSRALERAGEQITTYIRLLKPIGWLVLEESDSASWRVTPPAEAVADDCSGVSLPVCRQPAAVTSRKEE
jgi:hypothetical protein